MTSGRFRTKTRLSFRTSRSSDSPTPPLALSFASSNGSTHQTSPHSTSPTCRDFEYPNGVSRASTDAVASRTSRTGLRSQAARSGGTSIVSSSPAYHSSASVTPFHSLLFAHLSSISEDRETSRSKSEPVIDISNKGLRGKRLISWQRIKTGWRGTLSWSGSPGRGKAKSEFSTLRLGKTLNSR